MSYAYPDCTTVPPAAEQKKFKKDKIRTPGDFFLLCSERTTWPFLCEIYIECLAYHSVPAQQELSVATAVNILVPEAVSL